MLEVVVLWRLGFGDSLWVCFVGLAVGLWVVAVGDGGLGRLGLIFCICGVRVAGMGCGSPTWVWPCGLPAWVVEIVGKKKKK